MELSRVFLQLCLGELGDAKLQIKVIKVRDENTNFLSPFPKFKQEIARASIVGNSHNKLSIVNARRLNSLK